MLYFHGNAEDVDLILVSLSRLACTVNTVLYVVEYPGYGAATGRPSEKGCFEAADALWHHVTALGWDAPHIFICGRSLGSGAAVYLAAKHVHLAGLALISPLTSCLATQLGAAIARVLKHCDLMKNAERMKHVHCPLTVIHGEKDHVVPCSHGRQIHRMASDPFTPLWIPKRGHNDMPEWEINDHLKHFVDVVIARGGSETAPLLQ